MFLLCLMIVSGLRLVDVMKVKGNQLQNWLYLLIEYILIIYLEFVLNSRLIQ